MAESAGGRLPVAKAPCAQRAEGTGVRGRPADVTLKSQQTEGERGRASVSWSRARSRRAVLSLSGCCGAV